MIKDIKKITLHCDETPENREEISDVIDKLRQTGIDYAVIPVDPPISLLIRGDSPSAFSIFAQGRTEVNHYLDLLLDEKKLEEKKYNPTP
ncbi:MAG: hypothetical protein KKF46_04720 [Nanoarchaeota archaeon]|nr:hypothetical protein [Nanoarchaeota archaeon]MBU1321636.1 hypothetical protein [Nanoarchaeota archaeon]MBU1597420.1 hypothetical protein [Nanoarchaeota archaeon]MBU2440917.1 hypothetical protein [Nanoarchaeota archaeon]